MKTAGTKPSKSASASALIIAVILTSLLAVVGAMFIMMARVDKMATSAISENKGLDFAVETVVAEISQELVLDVPRSDSNGVRLAEYYDYSGPADKWLASLEPYEKTTGNYYWLQISDVYDKLGSNPELTAEIIIDYQNPSGVGDSNSKLGYPADADGDGVADSEWVKLDEITSDKGKPIYAAIRIVDNGGMLNVNTAYEFDQSGALERINGSSQMQINLLTLARRSGLNNLNQLDDARYGSEPKIPGNYNYIKDVIWQYNEPNGRYTPFDIADEIELRNRFLVNHPGIDTRIEEFWQDAFTGISDLETPISKGGAIDLGGWFDRAQCDFFDPNASDIYSYRHIATTCNMDRIIDPYGRKMLNINDANAGSVYNAIIDANLSKAVAAQTAVNLVDFRDYNDSNVSTIDVNGVRYYGFERPCIYISELAYSFMRVIQPGPIQYTLHRSFAIELHKPYTEDDYPEPNQWRLSIEGYSNPNWDPNVNWSGTKYFHVIYFEDPCATLTWTFPLFDVDPNIPSPIVTKIDIPYDTKVFEPGKTISLQRKVDANWISVDSVVVPDVWLVPSPDPPAEVTRSFKRDITKHKCIRRLWDISGSMMGSLSLGQRNPSYVLIESPAILIQAHPEDKLFTNVGEIGMLLRRSAYSQGPNPIDKDDTEADVRLNLADPCCQNLFQYLTVFDPAVYPWNDSRETRIKGRININTAPWYVLAQLPWVSIELAEAMVAYRDKLGAPINYSSRGVATGINNIREELGFESISELNFIISGSDNSYRIDRYKRVSGDLTFFPDLTPGDGAPDDFEERDVIFARISNLVTVRSDVFTAYILVRIGKDGPQRRVMAILDRSDAYSGNGKVKVIALHPVPDPR